MFIEHDEWELYGAVPCGIQTMDYVSTDTISELTHVAQCGRIVLEEK